MPKPLMWPTRRALGAAALIVSHVACSTQTVTISRWLPAEMPLEEISVVAVAPMAGPWGPPTASQLHEAIGATEQFVMVDIDAVAAARRDNAYTADLSHDDLLDLGHSLAADAVVAGRIDALDLHVAHHTVVDGHAQEAQCHLSREVAVRITGTLTILRMQDGHALHFAPIDHVSTHHELFSQAVTVRTLGACDDPEALAAAVLEPIDSDRLRHEALAEYAHALAHKLVPHWEGQEVEVYVDSGIPESKQAVSALMSGNWREAVALYSRGVEAAQSWLTPTQTRARAHYNLGTALVYGGMVEQGLAHLEQAQAIAPCARFAEQIADAQRYGRRPRAPAPRHRLDDAMGDGNRG